MSKVKPSRSSRRTRRGNPVDYSEAELESDTESEITLSGTILEVDSPVKGEEGIEREDEWELNQTWTPGTLGNQAKQVGIQFNRLAERNRQREMTETSNMERMLEMKLTLCQDKQRREDKREEERQREKRKAREREERMEERKLRDERDREERQQQLIRQLKEA